MAGSAAADEVITGPEYLKTKILSILLILGAAALVAGARYTRQVGASLTRPAAVSGQRAKVQFVKNPAPVLDVSFQDLEGRQITSAEWRGKVTIVNFWATWCPPCRAELPDMIALQQKYKDHLQIVGVSVDEASADDVRAFVKTHQINYPVAMVTRDLRRAFPGVYALPTSFVLDKEGRTVQRHVGLIGADIYEQETRVLAGLADDVTVEEVEDSGQIVLANAAHATDIPGLDLSRLSPERKAKALERLNADTCTCGCDLTLAQCRINDPTCKISLPLAQQLVKKIAAN
jgi:thiol-disulfide isomerase/thioredoxin